MASPLVAVVVDEDPAARAAVRDRLRFAGWDVREVSTAEAAMSAAGDDVAAVIIDTGFADDRGVELARKLRAQGCTASMVLVSAWFTPTVAPDAGPADMWVVSKMNLDPLWTLLGAPTRTTTSGGFLLSG